MSTPAKAIGLMEALWKDFDFTPNPRQQDAILHANGPLFLPAGPGSGKTRVLLWRVVNLIVTHEVHPDDIFLSTFTEKAALQLRNGLRTLIGAVSERTRKPYDTAQIYVGTVHSLCRRLLVDRRFSVGRSRAQVPVLLDELDQYMFMRRQRNWDAILGAGPLTVTTINGIFDGKPLTSRLRAIGHLASFFNRLSEEMIDPGTARRRIRDKDLKALLAHYSGYRALLENQRGLRFTDLSLLQQAAVEHLSQSTHSGRVFKHVIVDEYQDTNPVQERIFFELAKGHKNICVVGDDDQALYRFRGATVENFVEFPLRCQKYLALKPRTIVLGTNYRSREEIVTFYGKFIAHPSCDWRKRPSGAYRVMDKDIKPARKGSGAAVIASTPASPEDVAAEIAGLVRALIDQGRVEDPNQVAFLFPSLHSPHVDRMRSALADVDLEVYAPRAGQFLDVPESVDVFGLVFQAFGDHDHIHAQYRDWIVATRQRGSQLMKGDSKLRDFIRQKQAEIRLAAADHAVLAKVLDKRKWAPADPYDPGLMQGALAAAPGLSGRARGAINSAVFARLARERSRLGKPFAVGYAVTRATSLDWNVLDFLYHLSGFTHFKSMFDLAESGKDEGPVCNLSLVSQYLARFVDQYPYPVSGENLGNGQFLNLFANFLYVLFRRGESEYEDAEDPFPRGRIPFITIHQSKGLEFPVVVLGNPRKDPRLQFIEGLVSPLLTRKGEPLDRMPLFDVMRMFYVALSRAKNLLVVAHFKGQGQRMNDPFLDLLDDNIFRIPEFDVASVPAEKLANQDLPQSYSYTGDFLLYRKCPRQYMLFRKYGFVPSRSQTMFFGSLVHQTLEDLHQHLIASRSPVQ